MPSKTVTIKHEKTGATKTVEVTGAQHTQESAEAHVATQYGENAQGRGAHKAREWKVVPAGANPPRRIALTDESLTDVDETN